MTPDFTPLDKEELSIQKCLVCEDGYYLKTDKTCEILSTINFAPPGCLTYELDTNNPTIKHCRKCSVGYSLKKGDADGVWSCTFDC